MRIDLHAHSNRSDGTDTPAELVARACEAGLDVVALTDHDTVAGWAEAGIQARNLGIKLVCGAEFTTRNHGESQHLLGYEFEPEHPGIVDLLDRGANSRAYRVPLQFERLAELGVPVVEPQVYEGLGAGTIPSRKHFAIALRRAGHVASDAEAFDRYLNPGMPGYVVRPAPSIEEAIESIRAAGGVAVIAHPRGKRTHVSDHRLAELVDLGLSGIEVDHQEHDVQTRADLRALADRLGVAGTGSSDFHGGNKVDHDLGCNMTPQEVAETLIPSLRKH